MASWPRKTLLSASIDLQPSNRNRILQTMKQAPSLLRAFRYWRSTTERFADTHGGDYADSIAYLLARQSVWAGYVQPKSKVRLP